MTITLDITEYDVDKAVEAVKELDAVLQMIFLLWKGRIFLSFVGSKLKETINVGIEEFMSWDSERQMQALSEWWPTTLEHLDNLSSQILQHVHQKTVADAMEKWSSTLNEYYNSFPQFDILLDKSMESPTVLSVAMYSVARDAHRFEDRDRHIVGTITEPMFKLLYQRIKILSATLSRYTIQHAVYTKKRHGKHRPKHTFIVPFHGRVWKANGWNKYIDKLLADLQTNCPFYSNLSTVRVSCTIRVEDTNKKVCDDSEDDNLCSVCLSYLDIDDTTAPFQCSHEFHKECVSEWLNFKESADCPMCRSTLLK